jgi:hypothetical protein
VSISLVQRGVIDYREYLMSGASEASGPSGTLNDARTDVRTLLAFAAVALAISFAVRVIGRAAEHVGHTPYFYERLVDLEHVVPELAASEQPMVLLLGDSAITWTGRPELVDEELRRAHMPVSTYNLGMPGMTPDLMPPIAHLIASSYQATRRRPLAIVIALTPRFHPASELMKNEYAVQLAPTRELASAIASSPERGLRLLAHRYAMGGFSGEYISFRLSAWLDEDVPRWFGDLTPEQRFDLPDLPRLTMANRGSPYIPGNDAAYAAGLAEIRQSMDKRLDHDRSAAEEALEDSPDEALLTDASAAIQEVRAITNHTLLVLMPRNPCARLSARFEDRWRKIVAQLERATGATALDLSSGTLTRCEDFSDLWHPELGEAAPKLSRALGRELAKRLSAGEGDANWK